MDLKNQLLDKLRDRTAVIGVFGLGYVGVPLSFCFAGEGFPVLGFDVDAARVAMLNDGESYLSSIDDARFAEARRQGLRATADFRAAAEVDVMVICVPTPVDRHKNPDFRHLEAVIEAILPHLRRGQVISLESTSYPGTTDDMLCRRIEQRGLVVGEDVFVCFSPEREDPGNAQFSTRTIPKICSGATTACLEVGLALYGAVIDTVIPVRTMATAELAKLFENVYRLVNIALVNELKMLCHRMGGVDVHEVIAAAATKPFGFSAFRPGPGLGGHCIPVDPYYLVWKGRELGCTLRLVDAANELNGAMPSWVAQKLGEALNDAGIALRGARVMVVGVAYKKNIGDVRESPSIAIIELLQAKGVHVEFVDPHVETIRPGHGAGRPLTRVATHAGDAAHYDAVLIACDHDAIDYGRLGQEARIIVDACGRYTEAANVLVKA
ncbi:nucleotide sugar dehydrogenase [Burkholderia gladioli]|uniref:nucleotide sugar dehydrogenase n=1 Tax=Burkholderia gladioli TaxID=28095 RepID=UPI0016416895|nr:nucleotide sugar dehydrogenase [Burkholderia gladioli]